MVCEETGLILQPAGSRPGLWLVGFGEWTWEVSPQWPSPADLAAIGWHVEEAAQTPGLGHHVDAMADLARRVAAALWDSLVRAAPAGVGERLARELPAIRAQGVNSQQLAALSLLPAALPLPSSFALFSAAVTAVPPLPSLHPLRVLLVTCRPLRLNDAPYLSVAHAAAKAAAEGGCRLQRLYPPTHTELRRVLDQAQSAGDPFTVLIFDGHGAGSRAGKPCLIFESQFGPAWVDGETFLHCLGHTPPRLIVLAACRTGRTMGPDPLSSNFAAALAAGSGAEVVAMNYNIAPWQASVTVTQVLRALMAGDSAAAGVAQARAQMAQHQPGSLAWAAPVHLTHGGVRFVAGGGGLAPPPPGLVRHSDCLLVERDLHKRPVSLLLGVPLIGKSHFLSFYGWWSGWRTGALAAVHRDAREFDTPAQLLASLPAPDDGSRLITVDNVDHWRELPAQAWEPLFERAAAGAGHGLRWLLASRTAIDFPAHACGLVQRHILGGFAAAGMLDLQADFAEFIAYYFACAPDQDPWIIPLVIATRGEPVLLSWAAAAHAQGASFQSCLWQLVFADPGVQDYLAGMGIAGEQLAGVDPMLGWSFGMEGHHLLASLRFAPEDWEGEACAAASLELAESLAAVAQKGLALKFAGSLAMSPVHALLLRQRRPLESWSLQERERYAQYMECVRIAVSAYGNVELSERMMSVQARFDAEGLPMSGVSVQRLTYVALLLQLPAALAAARLATETGQAKVLANIVSGISRALTHINAPASARCWLEHWASVLEQLAATPAPEHAAARALLDEERQFLDVMAGEKSLIEPVSTALRDAVSSAWAVDSPDPDPNRPLRQLIAVCADVATPDREASQLIAGLKCLVVDARFSLDAEILDALENLAASRGSASECLDVKLLAAIAHQRRGDLAAAERIVIEIFQAETTWPVAEQFLANCIGLEIFLHTQNPLCSSLAPATLALAKQLGDEQSIGYAQLLSAQVLVGTGEIAQARYECSRAIRNLAGFSVLHQTALLVHTKILMFDGDLNLAEAFRAKAEREAGSSGNPLIRLQAAEIEPLLALYAGRDDDARIAAGRLALLCAEQGFRSGQGVAAWVQGQLHWQNEDYGQALECAKFAVAHLGPFSPFDSLPCAYSLLADSARKQDQLALACEAQHRVALEHENYYQGPATACWLDLELLALAADNPDLAAQAHDRTAALAPEDPHAETLTLAYLAIGWNAVGDSDRACLRAQAALQRPAGLGDEITTMLNEIIVVYAQ